MWRSIDRKQGKDQAHKMGNSELSLVLFVLRMNAMTGHPFSLRRVIAVIFVWFLSLGATMGQEKSVGLDERLDDALNPVASFMEGIVFYSINIKEQGLPIVLILLAGTSLFLTIYFRAINLRSIRLALRTVKGRYTRDDAPGQITHFQALSAALSATVGLGNIAGVAVAIGLGGPGATFWMVLIGLCGMTTKFCECTLGVRYRQVDANGKTYGGAMYYLRDGLAEYGKGMGVIGKILAIFFAVMCIAGAFGAGNMYQVNQAVSQITNEFHIFTDTKWIAGLIIAIVAGLVIVGGIRSIARVTAFLVPFMCGVYMLAATAIILMNLGSVGAAFGEIISGAFNPVAVGGGIVGVLIQGIKRGVFSNEAGIGSSPIAHSAVKTDKPASEGLVALLEPFVDTVVVCTMTALVLVITGTWRVDREAPRDYNLVSSAAGTEQIAQVSAGQFLKVVGETKVNGNVWTQVQPLDAENRFVDSGEAGWLAGEAQSLIDQGGVRRTSMAFDSIFKGFGYVLAIAVVLFAFSTMISWGYYGEQAVIYLFGRSEIVIKIYQVVFCSLAIVGAAASLDSVLRLSDAMLFAMVLPNLIGIYLLLPKIRESLNDFLAHAKKIDGQ